MAGQINIRQGGALTAPLAEQSQDLTMDFDGELDDTSESGVEAVISDKLIFAKSTDIRRRLEEKLEVKLLKDQLGMDDLGF